MVKRYGFGLFGEFTERREGVFVLHRDYAYLEQAFAKWKAETSKDVERIAEQRVMGEMSAPFSTSGEVK